jgi:hypothetical protein
MLMEIFGYIVTEIIVSFIGWVCLYVWYRDSKKVEEVKKEQYAGSFNAAGGVLILNFIAATGAMVISGILIFF